ncbi:MAG: FtsQ-type POTRA domain-containing protein, partial [Nocardioidaceae bacterium]|nr:FtsQ-type POTRA domain-containing protein [Nocardioidaceae bacterium]
MAAVLVLTLVVLGVYALYFSSWLRAERVEVSGNSLVPSSEILAAAEVPTGDPMVRVDLEAIETRVRSMAAVKRVEVSRKWPHGVQIKVTERVPVAVLERGT